MTPRNAAPIKCPECDAAMNHHADKVIYSDSGERVEEFHQCPACGAAASRVAGQQVFA